MARNGVEVDVSPHFHRLADPPPRRRIHSHMPGVFIHHAVTLWREKKAILLPTHLLGAQNVHFNAVHWTAKPGKPEGCFLGDCSNGPENQSLNVEDVKEVISRRYGELYHPSIVDIIQDIVDMGGNTLGSLQSLRLWKDDIVGACSHFNNSPTSAPLFTFEIDDTMSLVQYTGMFGWTGSPFAFGPISRALNRIANQRQRHSSCIRRRFYGNQPAALSSRRSENNPEIIIRCTGPNAVNPQKSSSPALSMDLIGWHICLQSETIRPSDRAIRKLMHAFFTVTCSRRSRIPLEKVRSLVSLASRYSMALLGL